MTARIFRPARSATQSGRGRSRLWQLVHEPAAPREIEPLMGWTSSADTNAQVRLSFATREEAEAYARNLGLDYKVDAETTTQRRTQSYSDNFRTSRVGPWTH